MAATRFPSRGIQRLYWIALAAVTLFFANSLWFASRNGWNFLFESGESPGDRQLMMALAQGAKGWGPGFFDPVSRLSPIFYQFPLFWAVGTLALLTGSQPWVISNLLQIFLAPAFFVVLFATGKRLLGGPGPALAATLLTLGYGSLEFVLTGDPVQNQQYGDHAQIKSFAWQIFGFYPDSWALLLDYLAYLLLLRDLDDPHSPRRSLRLFSFALLAGIAMSVHLLAAIFALALSFMTLMAREVAREKPRTVAWSGFAILLTIYLGVLVAFDFRPPMSAIATFAALLFVGALLISSDRKPLLALLAAGAIPAALAFLNFLALKRHTDSPFAYNTDVRQHDLAVPWLPFLVSLLPILALASSSLLKKDRSFRCLSVGLIAASFLTIRNDLAGYNNHPYRFIPFALPVLCMLAVAGAKELWSRVGTPFYRALLLGPLALLSILGIAQNLYSFHQSRWSYFRPVPEQVLATARQVEGIRSNYPESIFFLQEPLEVPRTATMTPAKMLTWSGLSWTQGREARTFLTAAESTRELLAMIIDHGFNIDFAVVLESQPAPPSELPLGVRLESRDEKATISTYRIDWGSEAARASAASWFHVFEAGAATACLRAIASIPSIFGAFPRQAEVLPPDSPPELAAFVESRRLDPCKWWALIGSNHHAGEWDDGAQGAFRGESCRLSCARIWKSCGS